MRIYIYFVALLTTSWCQNVRKVVTITIAGENIVIPDFSAEANIDEDKDVMTTLKPKITQTKPQSSKSAAHIIRSGGPNHIFEIFVSPQNRNTSLPIIDFSKQPIFELEEIKNFRNRKVTHDKPDSIVKNTLRSHSQGKNKVMKQEKPKDCKRSKESLESCVDTCTSLDDILVYSNCVVNCSIKC